MKYALLFLTLLFLNTVHAQSPGKIPNNKIMLPNGWKLSPAGRSIPLGDLPLNLVVSKSQKYFAVTNNGQSTQSIQLFDAKKNILLSEIKIAKSWYGLKFSSDEKKLYAGGGNDNRIMVYSIVREKLILSDSIKLPGNGKQLVSSAGLEIDDDRKILYTVTKEDNSLYLINLADDSLISKIKLPAEGYSCLLSSDRSMLYISCWGCDKVLLFDTKTQKLINEIAVGDNPNELCMDKKGKLLYVANSNDNSVSVIDIKSSKVIETLNAALFPDATERKYN